MTTVDPAKPEFPPLWQAGFHALTVDLVRAQCVDAFASSETRARLLESFETVLAHLEGAGLIGTVWLDGSFVTEKINPADIDFLFVVHAAVYDHATPEQRAVIDGLTDGCSWMPADCDTNVVLIDPPEHSNSPDLLGWWERRLGYSSDSLVPKGIVVISIGVERTSQ